MARNAQADTSTSYDLGIDSASDDASLALFGSDSDQPLAAHAFHADGSMTRVLLGEIAALLGRAGIDRRQIGRIAVTTGPGQYGALRAGIAVAQGLAVALDVPLAGIGRLQADAACVGAHDGGPIVAVHRTRTGPAWAVFAPGTDAPRELLSPAITSHAEAAQKAPRPAIWAGELDEELETARDAAGRTGDTIVGSPDLLRAVAIVNIARATEAFGDPAGVDAVYLRPPPITRPRGE